MDARALQRITDIERELERLRGDDHPGVAPVFNAVTMYGAKGDGTTDDSSALQAACDAAGSNSGIVYLPRGTYLVNTTIDLSSRHTAIVGAGVWNENNPGDGEPEAVGGSILLAGGSLSGAVLTLSADGCIAEGVQVDGNDTNTCIAVSGDSCRLYNVSTKQANTYGVNVTGNRGWLGPGCRFVSSGNGTGVRIDANDWIADSIRIIQNGGVNGLALTTNADGFQMVNSHVTGTTSNTSALVSISAMSQFDNCYFDSNGWHLVYVQTGSYFAKFANCRFTNPSVTDNTYAAIYCGTGASSFTGLNVSHCSFQGGGASNRFSYAIDLGTAPALAIAANFSDNTAIYCAALWSSKPRMAAQNQWYNGTSWKQQEEIGRSFFNGNGSTTDFVINHNIWTTPQAILVTAASAAANSDFHVIRGATSFTVRFATAPATGTNNVVLDWRAEV